MARAVQHSKASGVPPLVVAENLSDFDRQAELDAIDAFDGTPVLDIKPWLPSVDILPEPQDGPR